MRAPDRKLEIVIEEIAFFVSRSNCVEKKPR